MTERIQNTTDNGGINKITIEPIAEGSEQSNIFARYKKVTFYNDQSSKTEFIRTMPTDKSMGLLGFYYSGRKTGKYEWVFDGICRQEKSTPKAKTEFYF